MGNCTLKSIYNLVCCWKLYLRILYRGFGVGIMRKFIISLSLSFLFVSFVFCAKRFDDSGYKDMGDDCFRPIQYQLPLDLSKKSFDEVFRESLKQGTLKSMVKTTYQVLDSSFSVIPKGINKTFLMFSSLIYRFAFKSKGLIKADLARISNRIRAVCQPFTNLSLGNLDKKRRAALISKDQLEENPDDKKTNDQARAWTFMQKQIIAELEYGITYLNKNRGCYDLEYLNITQMSLRYQLARLIQASSPEDFDHILFYIKQAKRYLKQMILIIKDCKCEEQVYERHEEMKRCLGFAIGAFEQIGFFTDVSKSKESTSSFKGVSNLNSDSSMPGLESLSLKDFNC